MLIKKNINKIFNYKSISSLSLIGMGLIFSQQTTTAMLRNILSSSSRAIQTVSSSLSNQLRPSNQSQSVRYFYGSSGRRAIFTSNSSQSNLTSSSPINQDKAKIQYFYGSNGKRTLLSKNISQSIVTPTAPQNTSAIHTSSSASASTTKITNNSSSTSTDRNSSRSISNLLGEITKFKEGIRNVSSDYVDLSKQMRAHIEKLQRKSTK